MRLYEVEQADPVVGDILEIELGDEIVEAVITAIRDGEIIAETDNMQGATILAEGYGRYYCSTDKKWKERQGPKQTREGVAEGYEPGDKITWYHSNHFPEIEGTVEGWKDGHLIVKSVDPNPRNTEKTVARYRVPKNNILSHTKQGVAEAHPNSKIYDKCWDGYKKVPGKKRGEKGSCVKEDELNEAEYQGREVKLGKPVRGGTKKFHVYVKDPKTGNVKKVNFGDPNMSIKKSNPKRRKSFRARHNCSNPGPRTKARYWSCRAW